MGDTSDSDECSNCLEPRLYPAQLPCGHIFCFLCLKGFIRNDRCPLCRQHIPNNYLKRPIFMKNVDVDESTLRRGNDASQWFYEGRNGWWKYDERSHDQLEEAMLRGANEIELLTAGILYKIDFTSMLQIRLDDPSKRRKIMRAASTIPNKGVAGINIKIKIEN